VRHSSRSSATRASHRMMKPAAGRADVHEQRAILARRPQRPGARGRTRLEARDQLAKFVVGAVGDSRAARATGVRRAWRPGWPMNSLPARPAASTVIAATASSGAARVGQVIAGQRLARRCVCTRRSRGTGPGRRACGRRRAARSSKRRRRTYAGSHRGVDQYADLSVKLRALCRELRRELARHHLGRCNPATVQALEP